MHRTLWICTEFVFYCSVQRNVFTFISTFFYVVCVSSCPFGMKRCTSAHSCALMFVSCVFRLHEAPVHTSDALYSCCIVLGGVSV